MQAAPIVIPVKTTKYDGGYRCAEMSANHKIHGHLASSCHTSHALFCFSQWIGKAKVASESKGQCYAYCLTAND